MQRTSKRRLKYSGISSGRHLYSRNGTASGQYGRISAGKRSGDLGSGDIGLIMARRMTLEGAHVNVVAELMPYSGGLKRNIVQCLDDYGIPLKLSHTVVKIHGKKRVEGVTLAQVDAQARPIPNRRILCL